MDIPIVLFDGVAVLSRELLCISVCICGYAFMDGTSDGWAVQLDGCGQEVG